MQRCCEWAVVNCALTLLMVHAVKVFHRLQMSDVGVLVCVTVGVGRAHFPLYVRTCRCRQLQITAGGCEADLVSVGYWKRCSLKKRISRHSATETLGCFLQKPRYTRPGQ